MWSGLAISAVACGSDSTDSSADDQAVSASTSSTASTSSLPSSTASTEPGATPSSSSSTTEVERATEGLRAVGTEAAASIDQITKGRGPVLAWFWAPH